MGFVEVSNSQRIWAAKTFGPEPVPGSDRRGAPIPLAIADALLLYWSTDSGNARTKILARILSSEGQIDVLLGNADPHKIVDLIDRGISAMTRATEQTEPRENLKVLTPAASVDFFDAMGDVALAMESVNMLPSTWEYITGLPEAVISTAVKGAEDLALRGGRALLSSDIGKLAVLVGVLVVLSMVTR